VVAACTPVAGTVRQVTVSFAPPAGVDVAALTLLMDYPEEKVFMPPAGPQTQIGAANFVPLYPPPSDPRGGSDARGAWARGRQCGRGAGADLPVKFQDCEGATVPSAGEFNCTVLDATDPFTTPVLGVECSVTLP
jgi:hypothetical protein